MNKLWTLGEVLNQANSFPWNFALFLARGDSVLQLSVLSRSNR